ncbi:MAG: short-chain fatty acid transporter [Marinicella sp.]
MLAQSGKFFADQFKKWMPDAFVFALILTIVTALSAFFWTDSSAVTIISSWYDGFWILLSFGMQMVLILSTGFAIALSPPIAKLIEKLAAKVKSPDRVYLITIIFGGLLTLVSWGWLVLTAVLARELAKRVQGVDYAYLTACVFISSSAWVCGLSSSIPLLLNTPDNFLIQAGLLDDIIPTSLTLLSPLNLTLMGFFLIVTPTIMWLLRPKQATAVEMSTLKNAQDAGTKQTVAQEADALNLESPTLSDRLNNNILLQSVIVLMGAFYIVVYFAENGFNLNLNIMIFCFLILGMAVHLSPIRYVIAMKRACANISGIVFQYPFYAGIMGIMMGTGLGSLMASDMSAMVSQETLPLASYLLGALVNFSIPSAGGEWAVLGGPLVESAKELGAALTPEQMQAYIARIAMAVAYGETLTNLVQPFFLLIILPVMGKGIKIQARDLMGYLFLPFLFLFTVTPILIMLFPL